MSPPAGDAKHWSALGLAALTLSCGDTPAGESDAPDRDSGGGQSADSASAGGAKPATSDVPSEPPSNAGAGGELILEPDPPAVNPPEPATTECQDTRVEAVQLAAEKLRSMTVDNAAPVRRVLYSWTQPVQIDELRQAPELLTREFDSNGERGRALDVLFEARDASDPVATAVIDLGFVKTRHAWAHPWATLRGWTGEVYGNQLLRITLREEAYVAAAVRVFREVRWQFFDMQGNAVTQDEFLQAPERLGAIYFVDEEEGGCQSTLGPSGAPFREYVLCNEAMLESYEAFTDNTQQELASNIAALEALQAALTDSSCADYAPNSLCWRTHVLMSWADAEPLSFLEQVKVNSDFEPFQLYERGLAFPNDLYHPNISNLRDLLSALQAVPQAEPALEYRYPDPK